MEDQQRVVAHYDAVADTYGELYQSGSLEDAPRYPANYIRLQILSRRLAQLRAASVYEIGVGEGTPLVTFARMGLRVAGSDISENMVRVARENLERAGFDSSVVSVGDVMDITTIAEDVARGPYDAVVASGVLPHVENDQLFLENVAALLAPGGTCLIEFRNKLFSLFTLNRYTREFFLDDLLAGVDPSLRQLVAAELDARLAIDQPPQRLDAPGGAPGYDVILSRFHNPFELLERFRTAGFEEPQLHWYHYHPTPPLLESREPRLFRREALRLEHHADDWRGWFLCSAGIVEARARRVS